MEENCRGKAVGNRAPGCRHENTVGVNGMAGLRIGAIGMLAVGMSSVLTLLVFGEL